MPVDQKTSAGIEMLRFPLILGVVFLHNYDAIDSVPHPAFSGAAGAVEWIRFFISAGLVRAAVPLFFIISGYLYFSGAWSWTSHVHKLRRRVHTLLIPYLFWNLLTLAVYALAQSIPQTSAYASSVRFPPIHSFSLFDYLNAIFGIASNYPIAGQFWFIRDLMALVLLAPILHFLTARVWAWPLVILLAGLWCFDLWQVLWPSGGAALFFCLGAFLARPSIRITYLESAGPWISALCLLVLIFYTTFPVELFFLKKVVIALSLPSFWWLTGIALRSGKIKAFLFSLSASSFFVFAAHEPALTVLVKAIYKVLRPTNAALLLALYFLIPLGLIAVLMLLHRLLRSTLPAFTDFITGQPAASATIPVAGPIAKNIHSVPTAQS